MAKLTITGAKTDIVSIKRKLDKNIAVVLGDVNITYSDSENRTAYNKEYYKAHRIKILRQHRRKAREKQLGIKYRNRILK
jgi:hypothetical protein